ncbi:hypothetical protein BU17DRAFT_63803 [Hysterangium stoloniferum]|nr:hypothetical protein BU17DRAFT_63803 [Hysterangium stoloniferum]
MRLITLLLYPARLLYLPVIHELVYNFTKSICNSRLIQKITPLSVALYVWDILINLQREKELMWDKKFKASTFLYFMVRYPVIAKSIFQIIYTPETHQPFLPYISYWFEAATNGLDLRTQSLFSLHVLLSRIIYDSNYTITYLVCFILRVYVVTQGKARKFFTLVVSLLALASLAMKSVELTQTTCSETAPHIVFDLVVSLIVSWKLVGIIGLRGGLKTLGGNNISALLMRSGVLYFVLITIIQIAAVVQNFLLNFQNPQNPYNSFLNDYTTIFASVLIAHFLLDLRQALLKPEANTTYIDPAIDTNSTKTPAYAIQFKSNASQHWSTLITEFEADDVLCIGNLEVNMDEMTTDRVMEADSDEDIESLTRSI